MTFTADGATVKTMTVEDGYTLKDSDYPAVPTKTGYTGEWVKYTAAVHSNVTVQVKYTAVSTDHTVTFKANGKTVKTMVVPDGYMCCRTVIIRQFRQESDTRAVGVR